MKTGEEKVDPKELKRYAVQLKEKQRELKELDEKVLNYLLKKEDEDACDKEVEDASEYAEKVTDALIGIEEELRKNDETSSGSLKKVRSNRESLTSEKSDGSDVEEKGRYSEKRRIRVKLPQLEMKKFSGKIHEFQEFWDSFSSAIHENDEMAGVSRPLV